MLMLFYQQSEARGQTKGTYKQETKNHVRLVTRHVWEDYMEICEDIRQTIGMKDVYSHRKETIERIFETGDCPLSPFLYVKHF